MRHPRLGPLVLALLLLASPAGGEEVTPPPPGEGDWSVSAGAGVVAAPEYPGSGALRVLPIPVWNVVYRERFFSRGPDFAGVHVVTGPRFTAGLSLHYEFSGRDPGDDRRLEGTDEVDGTVRAKAFATAKASLFSLSLKVSQDVAGGGQGLLAGVDGALAVPFFPGWFFSVGPGATWGDRSYVETFYGISPAESARSGLPAFRPGAGIVDVHVNAVARRTLSERWGASLVLSLARLVGDAEDSPVTEERLQPRVLLSFSRRLLGPPPGRSALPVPPGP